MHQLRLAAFVGLLFSAMAANPAGAQGPASAGRTLRGYVVDGAGNPVPYVYVFERTAERFVVTDPDGWFVLVVPSQRGLTISARRSGYQPLEMQLDPRSDRGKLLRLVLTPASSATRPAGKIGGYNESLDRSGYYRRMTLAADATFITAEQISRRSSKETSDLLRDVSGINVVSRGATGTRSSVATSNSGCTLGVVIDGRRAQDETLPPSVSGAVEIYPSAAAVPEEFRHHTKGCGLILVWSS